MNTVPDNVKIYKIILFYSEDMLPLFIKTQILSYVEVAWLSECIDKSDK